MKVVSIDGKEFEIVEGMEVFIPCRNRGGHGAWANVTKIKRSTFDAIEQKGSYIQGMEWNVHKKAVFAIVERGAGFGWKKHWVNDY